MRKFVVVTVPAILIAVIVSMIAVELWVRWRWDERRGVPGFYISDPKLGQRLAPNYDGWFAGVPVHINSLGFRDSRDYSLDKKPGTFRILVLGDSVTFGHGTRQDTTYPYLLDRRLHEWRPDIDWQVWNLGVPGYNTRQEYDALLDVGPRFQPDLVIVGFYPNDFTANDDEAAPTMARRAASAVQRAMQRSMYSYEFYKKVILTLRYRWQGENAYRSQRDALAGADALLATTGTEPGQELTAVERYPEADVQTFECQGSGAKNDRAGADAMRAEMQQPGSRMARWRQAVRDFQSLARSGRYRIVFFVNMAPKICAGQDHFYDGGALADDEFLREVLGQGTPVVSSTREFLYYRPSQMPNAGGHAIGNANRLKANVLFDFLVSSALVPSADKR